MFGLTVINNTPWVSADVLATSLEYSRPEKLLRLYRDHEDEFAETDVFVEEKESSPKLGGNPLGGRPQKITYFSEDGAVLLCMFARTPIAKELRRQIRDVFMKWYRARKAALPIAQPELFPPAPPVPTALQGVLKLQTPAGEQSFSVVPVQGLSPSMAPAPSQLGYGGEEPPDNPTLLYNFTQDCAGMQGWYLAQQVADIVGCAKETVHERARLKRLPSGWMSTVKQRKVWLYIP